MAKKAFTVKDLRDTAMQMHNAQHKFFTHTKTAPKNRDTAWYDRKKVLLAESKAIEEKHQAMLAGVFEHRNDVVIGHIEE